jgi:hypothetical protein
MSKNSLIILFFLLLSPRLLAQGDRDTFLFLELPLSAHASALGGENITLTDDDLTLTSLNPALLSYSAPRTLSLNYLSYIDGVRLGSAGYSFAAGSRGMWAIGALYADYGTMRQVDEQDVELGTFSARDVALSGTYCYDLSDRWSGGVSTRMIYSHYADYSSFAIGVDLGLNYYCQPADFSLSVAATNLGGQITTFDDRREHLPFRLRAGISKRLAHAPLRLSVTLDDLTHWDSFKPLHHLVAGVDIFPADVLYLSLGYNFRRADELKSAGSSRWAGLTAGGGLSLKRIKIGAAYARYHTAASALTLNFGYRI